MSHNEPVTHKRLRNVQRVRRLLSDGRCNYHYYHRHSRTKLPGLPDTPEFLAAYDAAEREVASQRKQKQSIDKKSRRDWDVQEALDERSRRFFAEYGWRHG